MEKAVVQTTTRVVIGRQGEGGGDGGATRVGKDGGEEGDGGPTGVGQYGGEEGDGGDVVEAMEVDPLT